jgi:hypothetical protein
MYGLGWVIKKVTQVFPDPGIFGWHPLGFINDGLNALGGALEQQALANIYIVAAPIMTLARYGAGLVTRVVNLYSTLHNTGASIINGVIPRAVSEAEHRAASDIVRLDGQIVGDARTAFDAMVGIDTPGLAGGFIPQAEQSPTLGAQIAGVGAYSLFHSGHYTDAASRTLTQKIETETAKVAAQAQTNLQRLNADITARLAGDAAILSTLTHDVTVTLPQDIASKVAQAQAQDAQALNAVNARLQSEIDTINGQIVDLTSRVKADEALLLTARQNIATLQSQERDLVDKIAQAQAQDAQALAQAQAQDAQALAQAQAQNYKQLQSTRQTLQTSISQQQQLITKAQQDIYSNTTAIQDAQQRLTGISNTLGPVQKAQQLNSLQLAPFEALGATALPVLLQTLTSTLNQVKTKLDTCVVETCDPTSPQNIKNVLKDLLGLLTAGAEIGFISEAIHNPIGVADAMAPLIDGINSAASDTLSVLLSL